MQIPELPNVRSLAGRIVDGIIGDSPSGRRWVVRGAPASGKSLILAEAAAKLREAHWWVLRISPPLTARDTGLIAASQLSSALHEAGAMTDTDHRAVHTPSLGWETKASLLGDAFQWFQRGHRELVVFLEEPNAWPTARTPLAQLQAMYIATMLETQAHRIVMSASRRGDPQHDWEQIESGAQTDLRAWLDSPDWGTRSPAAQELLVEYERGSLGGLSPLIARLVVTFAYVAPPGALDALLRHAQTSGHELPRALYDCLTGDLEPVRRVWAALSLVRESFDEDLLSALDAPPPDDHAGRLLRLGLLDETAGRYSLHSALRGLFSHSRQPADAHLRLSYYYRLRLEHVGDAPSRDSFEAYHHASSALDVDLVSHLSPMFADQVWEFSDRLLEARRHGDAQRYLQHVAHLLQPPDQELITTSAAYHHRLAFSADGVGDAETAETHYQLALESDARDPQVHAHYICLLIDLGRVREAQAAWDRAMASLPDPEELGDAQVAALHGQVAWRLVRTHELNFAEDVLSELPMQRIEDLPPLRAVHARLKALRLAQKHGPVRPFAQLVDGWWRTPPTELPLELDDRELRVWWAGRVTELADDGVVVQLAEVELGDEEWPRPGVAELTFDELVNAGLPDARALTPGRFLVAGYYGNENRLLVRVVTPSDTRSGLPRPELDPQRYLRPEPVPA